MTTSATLANLKKNTKAEILGFTSSEGTVEVRLREIGFAEGDVVEILHKGLFGGSPLNVRLHGTSIAIRPAEANMILVAPVTVSKKDTIQIDIAQEHDGNEHCCGVCKNDN